MNKELKGLRELKEWIDRNVTGRVAYKQMVPKDERRSIEGEGKEKNLTGRVVTAIYIKERGAPA